MQKEHLIIILAVLICIASSILFFQKGTKEEVDDITSIETAALDLRDTTFVKVQDFLTTDCLVGEGEECKAEKRLVSIKGKKIKKRLMVAEFTQSDRKMDKVRYETWTTHPSNDTQGTRLRLVSDNYTETNRTDQHSLRVMYDTETYMPVANGMWIRTPNVDVSRYDYFSFWVKGDPRIGYSRMFSIGFLNGDGEFYLYRIDEVISEWKRFVIKLKYTKGKGHLDQLNKIYLVFNSSTLTKAKGILYFDRLEFLRIN